MSRERFGRMKAILTSAHKTNHITKLNIYDDMNAIFYIDGNMVDLEYDDYEHQWDLVLYEDKKKIDYKEDIDPDGLINFIYKYRKDQE